MLVSHTYKFIYIKTHKTASTSIQFFLTPFCQDGIVDSKKNRHRTAASALEIVGKEVWDTYTKVCAVRNPWDKMVSRYHWRKRNRGLFYSLKRILRGLHPLQEERRFSFEEWILDKGPFNIDEATMYLDGNLPDYFFIRYESLREDLKRLCDQLGMRCNLENLPNEKSGFRKSTSYREYYTQETRDIVAEGYRTEIEKFGYEF